MATKHSSIDELCINNPLDYACLNGHLPIVQYPMQKGADIEAKDRCPQTPLHKACAEGHLPIVQCLVEKEGIDVNKKAKAKD